MPLGEGVRSPAPTPGIVQGAASWPPPACVSKRKYMLPMAGSLQVSREELGHYMFSSLRTAGEFTMSDASKLNPGFRS